MQAPITKPGTYGSFEVRIYYEDTDHSGVVYHPNYLRYYERAREHLLGPDRLVDLWNNDGLGFVVYTCEMTFKEGAKFGDVLDIRTTPYLISKFRIGFNQQVWRKGGPKPLVLGKVEMVCVDKNNKMVELPPVVMTELAEHYGMKI